MSLFTHVCLTNVTVEYEFVDFFVNNIFENILKGTTEQVSSEYAIDARVTDSACSGWVKTGDIV